MTTFTRLLPDVTKTPILRKAALTAAGLAFTGGAIAGPLALSTTAAHAAPATPAAVVHTDNGNGHGNGNNNGHGQDNGNGNAGNGNGNAGNGNGNGNKPDTSKPAASEKELQVNYQAQPNFYYCGPAATRNALTADGHDISMDDLAHTMGTTEAGTNSANDITAALNKVLGADKYHTTELRDHTVTPAQMDALQADIKKTIDDNRALVANVAGTATDTDGMTHSYEGGHYIAVNGYRDDGRQALIADSANPNVASYWISTIDLANWMATRGYSH